MVQPSTREILFGCDEPAESELKLCAGPLLMTLRGTQLVHLCCDGVPVWHGLAFVFRDEHWGTPQPVLKQLAYEVRDGGFQVRLAAEFVYPRIALDICIDGQADGTVRYQARATAQDELLTNRTGLCLMHPLDAVGRAVTVTHADGRQSHSTFPRQIAPWPPFMSVQAVAHEWAPGRWAHCGLEGDVFELEDQRNNADASFKTYSRSNMMPRPYRLSAGQVVTQAATLRLGLPVPVASVGAVKSEPAQPHTRSELARSGVVQLGVGLSPSDCHPTPALLCRLGALRPRHLHLHLAFADEPVDWRGLAGMLQVCQARLRMDVVLSTPEGHTRLAALAATLRAAGIQAEAVGVFPSTPPVIAAAQAAFGVANVGGGTLHFFTQLNRSEDLGPLDFISFTTSALVHGADDDAIMVGLQSLPFMMETLTAKFPNVPVRIGPSAIPARDSPLGAQPDSDGNRRLALAKRDPRTRGLFGAAWLLGYVAALAASELQALTLMQLQGDSGLLQGEDSSPVPAYFALQALLAGQAIEPLTGLAAGLCGVRITVTATQHHLLLSNLCAHPMTLATDKLFTGRVRTEAMDEHSLRTAGGAAPWRQVDFSSAGQPLELSPYALLRVQTQAA